MLLTVAPTGQIAAGRGERAGRRTDDGASLGPGQFRDPGLRERAYRQRPIFWSKIGLISHVHVSVENSRCWYWAFNPAVDKSLKGDNASKGFSFTPAAKVSYDVTSRVAAGLEYYGDLGQISHVEPARKHEHLIFPVLDIDLGPRWEFNLRGGAHVRHGPTHHQGDPGLPVRPDGDAVANPVARLSAPTDRSEPRRSHHSR
jgi:hypothetical protein